MGERAVLAKLKSTYIQVHVDDVLQDRILSVTYTYREELSYHGVLILRGAPIVPFEVPKDVPKEPPMVTVEPKPPEDMLFSVGQRFTYNTASLTGSSGTNPRPLPLLRRPLRTMRLRPRRVLCSRCRSVCHDEDTISTRKQSMAPIPAVAAPRGRDVTPEKCTSRTKIRRGATGTRSTSVISPPATDKGRLMKPSEGGKDSVTRENGHYPTRSRGSSTTAKSKSLSPPELRRNHKPEPSRKNPADKNTEVCERASETKSAVASDVENEDDVDLKMPELEPNSDTMKVPTLRYDVQKRGNASDSDAEMPDILASECDSLAQSPDILPVIQSSPVIKISIGPQGVGTVLRLPPRNIENPVSDVPCDKNIIKIRPMKRLHKSEEERTEDGSLIEGSERRSKHHKHKAKHRRKMKNKDTKNGDRFVIVSSEGDAATYERIRNDCLRQKLSISLKRLSTTSEEQHGGSNDRSDAPILPHIDLDDIERADDGDDDMEPVRDTKNAGRVVSGDIVWGKIAGFPWWPGRILSLETADLAHVSWFGSSTTSSISCEQLLPFVEEFKSRYNRKKRGQYKEAVRQATTAAQMSLQNQSCQELEDVLLSTEG